MINSNTRCDKCDKTFKSVGGLRIHNFRVHTHKGRRISKANLKKASKARWSKKPPIVMHEDNTFNTAPKAIAYCPCCGVDLRKISIALAL